MTGSDWTRGPSGATNTSPLFLAVTQKVADLIRSGAHSLLAGNAEGVAGTIVATLAHDHGMTLLAPGEALLPPAWALERVGKRVRGFGENGVAWGTLRGLRPARGGGWVAEISISLSHNQSSDDEVPLWALDPMWGYDFLRYVSGSARLAHLREWAACCVEYGITPDPERAAWYEGGAEETKAAARQAVGEVEVLGTVSAKQQDAWQLQGALSHVDRLGELPVAWIGHEVPPPSSKACQGARHIIGQAWAVARCELGAGLRREGGIRLLWWPAHALRPDGTLRHHVTVECDNDGGMVATFGGLRDDEERLPSEVITTANLEQVLCKIRDFIAQAEPA